MATNEAELNIREIDCPDQLAETAKYAAEPRKLEAEVRKFDGNRWLIVITAMTAGATLFSAGASLIRLSIRWFGGQSRRDLPVILELASRK
jgi:hypothetical protein